MKKLIFIIIMLVVASSVYSQSIEDEAKSIVDKGEEAFQEFQQKFQTLKAYDTSKQTKDALKQMVDMINRYKKLVEDKIIEIEGIERTGKPVPKAEFDSLKRLMDRYHEMTVNLANWINTKK